MKKSNEKDGARVEMISLSPSHPLIGEHYTYNKFCLSWWLEKESVGDGGGGEEEWEKRKKSHGLHIENGTHLPYMRRLFTLHSESLELLGF